LPAGFELASICTECWPPLGSTVQARVSIVEADRKAPRMFNRDSAGVKDHEIDELLFGSGRHHSRAEAVGADPYTAMGTSKNPGISRTTLTRLGGGPWLTWLTHHARIRRTPRGSISRVLMRCALYQSEVQRPNCSAARMPGLSIVMRARVNAAGRRFGHAVGGVRLLAPKADLQDAGVVLSSLRTVSRPKPHRRASSPMR
jgi:hypothetical protein